MRPFKQIIAALSLFALLSGLQVPVALAAVDVSSKELQTFAPLVLHSDDFGEPVLENTSTGVLATYNSKTAATTLKVTIFASQESARQSFVDSTGTKDRWYLLKSGDSGKLMHDNGNLIYEANGLLADQELMRTLILQVRRSLSVLFPPRSVRTSMAPNKASIPLSEELSIPLNGRLSFSLYGSDPVTSAGRILDSQGAKVTPGDLRLDLMSDGTLRLQFYAPGYDTACFKENGMVIIQGKNPLSLFEWNRVTLGFGAKGLVLTVNDKEEARCNVEQARNEGVLYLGPKPGGAVVAAFTGSIKNPISSYDTDGAGHSLDSIFAKQLFLDLPVGDPSTNAFAFLKGRGAFLGTDGYVYPEKTLNRAEMVKVLLKAYRVMTRSSSMNYVDVDSKAWFYSYLQTATAVGMVTGSPDGHFLPAHSVNRAEFFTMLARLSGKKWSYKGGYKDVSGEDWFGPGASFARSNGLILGDAFSPKTLLTHRDVANALYAILK